MIRRLVFTLVFALAAFGQEDTPLRPLPMGDVLLSLPSNQIAPAGQWDIRFSHRFNQTLSHGSLADQFHSFFGLDSNADVVFGASYAMRPNLQLSLIRSNANDTYEAGAKYVLLRQPDNKPLNLTLRGGVDFRTERDLEDRTSFFAQGIVSRQFGRKGEIFFIPTVVTNAGRTTDGTRSTAMFDYAFNMPVGFAWTIRPGLLAIAEVTPPNQDLPDDVNADLGWAIGIKRNIGGHWFEILLSNSQSMLVDQYVTTTYQGTPLDASDVRLGFNIERRFGKRR
jgi:hypothetical protein